MQRERGREQRAYLLRPRLVTVAVTPTPLFPGESSIDAFWVLVQVRSVGAATWVRIGDSVQQVNTFKSIGDYQIYDVPPGYIFNAAELHASTDVAGPVLEITGMFGGVLEDAR